RNDPPPSLPWASGTAPPATSAADPADDAPDEYAVCQGLRTSRPGDSAPGEMPNSESCDLPRLIGPMRSNESAAAPCSAAGWARNAAEPCCVGRPATSTLSLMNVGTPAKHPCSSVSAARCAPSK